MLYTTLDECQTSFQLENSVHFSSQNDQLNLLRIANGDVPKKVIYEEDGTLSDVQVLSILLQCSPH